MNYHKSGEVRRRPWQMQVLASLGEFDSAQTHSQRIAALGKLQALSAGKGPLKKVLRRCLALVIRAERLEACQIRAERRPKIAWEVPYSTSPVDLPVRFFE
jgi:hypothetical protein